MRVSLLVLLLAGAWPASECLAQGASGTLKVRRSQSMEYFIDVDTPPTARPLPASSHHRYTMQDGLIRVMVDCPDCTAASGRIWMELQVSAKGEVEGARVTESTEPSLKDQLEAFASQRLEFEPTIIEGKRRPVKFAYPLIYVVD